MERSIFSKYAYNIVSTNEMIASLNMHLTRNAATALTYKLRDLPLFIKDAYKQMSIEEFLSQSKTYDSLLRRFGSQKRNLDYASHPNFLPIVFWFLDIHLNKWKDLKESDEDTSHIASSDLLRLADRYGLYNDLDERIGFSYLLEEDK